MKLFYSKLTASFFILLVFPFFSHAQITWDNASTGTDWYTAANWAPNTSQAGWTSASEARFVSAGIKTVGIDMGMGALSIGRIYASVGSLLTNQLTIGNSSSTAGSLTLNGDASGNILYALFNTVELNKTVLGGTGVMDIALVNANSNIQASFASIKIGADITGNDKNLSLLANGSGSGIIELSGANTYTGLTTMTGGAGSASLSVVFSHAGGGTLPSGNSVQVNSKATLRIKTSQTLNTVTLASGGANGFLIVEDGAILTITNKLKTGPGQVTVLGSGKIVYAPGATLEYYGSPTSTVNTSSAEFPAADGPANLVNNFTPFLHLHASRTLSGSFTGGPLYLNAGDLTVGSVVLPSYVVTNSTGRLFINAASSAPVTYPVYSAVGMPNFVTISNGQNINYGVRVEQNITPVLPSANNAVNRTWFIQPSATPAAPVDVQFSYSNTDGNAGFNYTDPVDLLQYTTAWNVLQTNIVQSQPLNTTIASLTGGVESIFAIQNATGALASAAITIAASKQSGSGYISWTFNSRTADVKEITLEKSADGRLFNTLAPVTVNQSFYTDNHLLAGKNYYRIKVTDVYGSVSYSAIAALLNSEGGFDIISLLPNIVAADMQVSVAASKRTKLNLVITDAAGRPVIKTVYNLVAGSNMLQVNAVKLAAGLYYITGTTAEGEVKTMRFIKQ